MDEITFKDGSSTTVGTVARSFEADRDLVTAVENKWTVSSTMTTISKYAYRNDEIGRRTDVVNTGTAFSASRLSKFDYDDRNELTESHRYNGTDPDSPGTAVTAQFFDYTFDPIGNRATYSGDSIEGAASYVTNAVNEYTSAVTPNETLTYDADGNLLTDATRTYTWDAENRLASVVPTSPTTGSKKVEFEYDWMGRRTRKKIYNYTTLGGTPWTLATDRRFVYDGWNLLAEYNYASSTATLKTKFTWGLDLSGQNGNNLGGTGVPPVGLHGAGGIGGLLAMVDVANTRQMAYFYNANGDVGQVVDSDSNSVAYGSALASYEYYPFGGIFLSEATPIYTPPNPFKFSTKYRDDETSLYYYGYRYHMPRMGRWTTRDPVAEDDNILVFLFNQPTILIDPYGLDPASQPTFQSSCACKCSAVSLSFQAWVTKPTDPRWPPQAQRNDRGALLAMNYLASGSGDPSHCKFMRSVLDEIWTGCTDPEFPAPGEKCKIQRDRFSRPDNPPPGSFEITRDGASWLWNGYDSPGMLVSPQGLPAGKVATYSFYVVDSNGHINPACWIDWTLSVTISKTGQGSASMGIHADNGGWRN